MTTTRVKLITVFFFGCLVMLLNVGTGHAAPCTPGTDCYCDKVKTAGSPIFDANLLLCEDFEAPTLYKNQGVGNGAPYYGPWYDDLGLTGDRGHNSYWNRKYGNGVNSMLFNSGEPAGPTLGSLCGFSACTGMKIWDPTNRWSANAYSPLAAIYTQASDFSAEIGTITPPRNAAGGGSGVFDGNANFVHRYPLGSSSGIKGVASWATAFEVGMTMAVAYPNNATSSGIWGTSSVSASVKHNEWNTVTSPNCGYDGLFIFYNQQSRNSWPFAGFIGSFGDCAGSGGISPAYCAQVVAIVGTAGCGGGSTAIQWQADTTLYQQTRDWPEGSWGCVRGHMSGIGTTSSRHRVWFTPTAGPNAGIELLIVDFTYNDDAGSNIDNRQGYRGLSWNGYANTNQGGGYVPTTQLTFRYEDNVHLRAGTPVSCSQIGFGGSGGGGTPPAAPTGLKIF